MSSFSASGLLELLMEDGFQWAAAAKRLAASSSSDTSINPVRAKEEAHYADPSTNLTALHQAVIRRNHPLPTDFYEVIEALLKLNPEATSVRCTRHGYTPLASACVSSTHNADIAEDAKLVKLLLEDHPSTVGLMSKFGQSPASLHIRSVSKQNLHQSPKGRVTSTAVLQVLADATSDQAELESALETLYSCNTSTIMTTLMEEETRASRRIHSESSEPSNTPSELDGFWVWDFALVLLKCIHQRLTGPAEPPFQVLDVMSQIKDCPPAFLMLAMRAFPDQLSSPDGALLNLPLHNVASWSLEDEDPLCRKSMAVTSMSSAYPEALKIKNKRNKTPADLEEKSGSFVGTGC